MQITQLLEQIDRVFKSTLSSMRSLLSEEEQHFCVKPAVVLCGDMNSCPALSPSSGRVHAIASSVLASAYNVTGDSADEIFTTWKVITILFLVIFIFIS